MIWFNYLESRAGNESKRVGGWFENQKIFRRWLMHESNEGVSYSMGSEELKLNRHSDSCAFRITTVGTRAIIEAKGGTGQNSYREVLIQVVLNIPYEAFADRYKYHTLEGDILKGREIEAIGYKSFHEMLKTIREGGTLAYETEEDEKENITLEVMK